MVEPRLPNGAEDNGIDAEMRAIVKAQPGTVFYEKTFQIAVHRLRIVHAMGKSSEGRIDKGLIPAAYIRMKNGIQMNSRMYAGYQVVTTAAGEGVCFGDPLLKKYKCPQDNIALATEVVAWMASEFTSGKEQVPYSLVNEKIAELTDNYDGRSVHALIKQLGNFVVKQSLLGKFYQKGEPRPEVEVTPRKSYSVKTPRVRPPTPPTDRKDKGLYSVAEGTYNEITVGNENTSHLIVIRDAQGNEQVHAANGKIRIITVVEAVIVLIGIVALLVVL